MSMKSENLAFSQPPTVEHDILANWPLPDGSKGLNFMELYSASEADPRVIATMARERAIQTLGNLTSLRSSLNSAQSNLGWQQKRPELMRYSLAPQSIVV
jgi:hypothetical protein